MTFPSPDVGVEAFPSADIGLGLFPSVDAGVEEFPPMPIPTIFAAVALVMTPDAARAVVPWRDAAVSLTLTPAVVSVASVEIVAASGLAIDPLMSPTEEIDAPMMFELTPAVELAASAVLSSAAGLVMTSGMQGTPVAVVTADAITELSVTAVVAVAGIFNAPAGLAMTPAAALVAAVELAADAGLTVSPAGEDIEVITYRGSGMYRTGAAQQLPSFGSEAQITGWSPDTALFPGSTVTSDDLVIQDNGEGVTVQASIWFTTSTSRTLTVRMLLNSVEIATNGGYTGTGSRLETLTVPNLSVTAGSVVRVVAKTSVGNSWSVAANTASYVRAYLPD